jgi:hypothetical protein
MNRWLVFLYLSMMLVPIEAGTKKADFTVPVRYEGGTLSFDQGRLKAAIADDELVLTRGDQKVSIPIKNITAVTCGTDVRRRFGAVVLGVVPGMHLDTAEQHYIGLTWDNNTHDRDKATKAEAVLSVGNGEYGDFLAALERLTGKKAINTRKVPTVVRYEL